MAISFGHRWTANYGSALDGDKLSDAALIWQKGLSEFEIDEIANGLNNMVDSGIEWPPSLPQFVEFCRNKADVYDPHKTAAYREYRKDRLLTKKPDPEIAKKHLAELNSLVGKSTSD